MSYFALPDKGALLSVTSFTRSVVSFQLSTAFPPSKREVLASRSLTLDGLPFSSFVVAEAVEIPCIQMALMSWSKCAIA